MRLSAMTRHARHLKRPSILLALAALVLCGFGFSRVPLSQAAAPTRAGAPAAVPVSPDIESFLKQVGDAYGSPGLVDLSRHLAADFLYQGMNKEAFIDHLKENQKYLGKLAIVPINYRAERDTATVVAYAISPRGVVAPSLQLLPLNIGATLIKQDGVWKLRGNQRPQEAPLYRELASVTADFPPSDLEAYRRLIPAGYEAPKEPLVRVAVTNWLDMEPPQTPYRLINLSILVRKNEENFWYIVAMPETDWLAVKAGNAVGFPKFVTDIDIRRSWANEWKLEVSEQARPLMRAAFESDADARKAHTRQTDAWLVLDKERTEIRAWMSPLDQPRAFSQGFGWMTVETLASPWKELIAPGSKAAATTVDVKVGLKLNVVPLLYQAGAYR